MCRQAALFGRFVLLAGQLPLDDAIGEAGGTPQKGGHPGGQRLDVGGGHPGGRSRARSQLRHGSPAAAVETGAGLHANGVGGEGLQAAEGLLGGRAFRQLQTEKLIRLGPDLSDRSASRTPPPVTERHARQSGRCTVDVAGTCPQGITNPLERHDRNRPKRMIS